MFAAHVQCACCGPGCMGCVVECFGKGACPCTSFLTHFLLPHHNAGQGKCRPFAIVCSKWQMLLLAAFSFSFRLHCDEVVLSQVGLPPPQPFGLQGAGRKKRDCKKRQATATTTINHLPLLPFCQTPGSKSQSFASAKGPKSKYTSSNMFCRTPDALTTGGTLLGRGRGSIRGMALQQKMST